MKIARVIVKQSAIKELMAAYPTLFNDPKIIMEIQVDSKFNKDIAVDQIEEYNRNKL